MRHRGHPLGASSFQRHNLESAGAGHAHGHYTNMMNPKVRRVGFVDVGGKLHLTNDFSQ